MTPSSIESVDFEPVQPQKRPSLSVLTELDSALRQEVRQKGIDVIVAEFSFWESQLHRDGKRLRHSLKQISQEQLEARLQEKLKCYNTMGTIWSQSIGVGCRALSAYTAFRAPAMKNVFDLASSVCKQVGGQISELNKSFLESTQHRYDNITALKQDHNGGMQSDERSWQETHQTVDRVHQTQQRVFELLLSSTGG